MATPEPIEYVWTELDATIAKQKSSTDCKGSPQCAIRGASHTCLVTPYGLRPAGIKGFSSIQPGSRVRIADDVSHLRKLSAMPGWVDPFLSGMEGLEWWQEDFPADVATLGDLVKVLAKRPREFPEAVYGKPTAPNAALLRRIFEYWGNGAHRAEVIATDASWIDTRKKTPESLKMTAGKQKIAWVPRRKVVVASMPVAPDDKAKSFGIQNLFVDDKWTDVDAYIKELDGLTESLTWYANESEKAERERLVLITRLQAVRALAQESKRMGPAATSLVEALDGVLPRAREALWKIPAVAAGNDDERIADMKRLRETGHSRSRDLVAGTAAAISRLREMVDTRKCAGPIRTWCESNAYGYARSTGCAVERGRRLAAALARARHALNQAGPVPGTGPTSDDESLIAIWDRAPSEPAGSADKLVGETPTELVLSMVGKELRDDGVKLIGYAGGFSSQLVGNLAGPPSLSIALVEGWETWKFGRLAAKAAEEARQSGGKGFSPQPWIEFAEEGVKRIPEKGLRELVQGALLDGNEESLASFKARLGAPPPVTPAMAPKYDAVGALKSKVGAAHAGNAQSTLAWKGFANVVNIINLAVTLYNYADQPKETVLEQVTVYANLGAGVATAVLGSIELLLTLGKNLATYADVLNKANCVVGLVTSLVGVLEGSMGLYEELFGDDDADPRAVATSGLKVVGNAAMAYFCYMAVFGTQPASWPVAAFALVCLVASGALSMEDIGRDVGVVCETLIKSVRSEPLFGVAERADEELKRGLDKALEACKSTELATIYIYDEAARNRLRRAGLSDAIIDAVSHAPVPSPTVVYAP